MIVDTMSPSEIKKELLQDFDWIHNMRNGWNKKYRKRLQLKYSEDLTILEHKMYKSPLHNNVHCFFGCKQRHKWNELVWWLVWEVLTFGGKKRYIIFDILYGKYTLVTPHAVERMQERSGKTFLEMFEENIKSSTRGTISWLYYKGRFSDELMGKFGNGFLLGCDDAFGNSIAKTYVSNSMQFENQAYLVNKSVEHSEALYKDDCNEFHSRKYKRENYVKVSA